MKNRLKNRKGLLLAVALVLAVFAGTIVAQTFFFYFVETPFAPNNYSWQEPWEVKEMIDFVEAELTLTGCAYQGQSHDVELVISNVATVSDYYLVAFDYLAKWYVNETSQETIIAGAYTGEPLAVSESVTYTSVWTPTVIGVGAVKMNVIDIVWTKAEPITWTEDQLITGAKASDMAIIAYEITGATKSIGESGNVAFTIQNNDQSGVIQYDYKVEVVELGIIIAEGIGETITFGTTKDYSFDFNPMPSGGSLTMLITVSNCIKL